jgi:hypothetical protein
LIDCKLARHFKLDPDDLEELLFDLGMGCVLEGVNCKLPRKLMGTLLLHCYCELAKEVNEPDSAAMPILH